MKKTVVDQIEITSVGIVQVRLRKLLIDGEDTHDLGFHRISMEPGADIGEALPILNESLANIKAGPVSDAEWARVKAHCELAWK